MKVAIGCDHVGFLLKEGLKKKLQESEYLQITDFGCFSADSVDYPDFGFSVAEAVARKEFDFGILVCSSGVGMSVVANKVKGIRAALCFDKESAWHARQHNDANVLVLAGKKITPEKANEIAVSFLQTPFSGEERHARRIGKIDEYEINKK